MFTATTHDPNFDIHIHEENFKYRVYGRLETSDEELLFNSYAQLSDFTNRTFIYTTDDLEDGDTVIASLADGIHNLKLEVEDRAGNISEDFLLDVLIDNVAYLGDIHLHPESDTGIDGFTATKADRITRDNVPTFFGVAEADNLVMLAIDGVPAATTVAVPLDGDDIYAKYGDEFALPVVGNFDPPVAGDAAPQ